MNTREKLQQVLDKFKAEISPEQFSYKTYVLKSNPEEGCGTVCCFAGWFPKLFPEVGIFWKKIGKTITIMSEKNDYKIFIDLEEFFNAPNWLIDALFYAERDALISKGFVNVPKYNSSSDYETIIKVWEYVIDNYEKIIGDETEEA